MLTIKHGDCRNVLAAMPDKSVHCCVTSPPYFGLRDYGIAGQIGLEPTPDAYVAELVAVFREVRRVLRDDGTLWLNLGDSYASQPAGNKTPSGFSQTRPSRRTGNGDQETVALPRKDFGVKPKDLIGIPWRVAFALQADGWYLRQDIIWSKPNPMPESVTDRCTKAHEYIFLMSKSARYFYDAAAIREENSERYQEPTTWQRHGQAKTAAERRDASGINADGANAARFNGLGRNRRSVWEVASQPFAEAHFATFPPDLIEPCIKAGCPKGGTVLDPFGGAGTTGLVADRLGRNALLIELNPEYTVMAERRIRDDAGLFMEGGITP